MKVLSHGARLSNSPFRRRHPTSEEIVEEVYRRVQEQQQLLQAETNPKGRSNCVNLVTKNSPSTSNTSISSGGIRSSTSSNSPESRTDIKDGERAVLKAKSESRQKTRAITPFGRRRNNTANGKATSLEVTQLVAEYTSHNPGRVILDSPATRKQSTTFLTVEDKAVESHSKDRRSVSRGNASSWASIRRKKSLDSTDSTLLHKNINRIKQQSSQSSNSANLISQSKKQEQQTVASRSQRSTKKIVQGDPSLLPVKSSSRQARSMSPFFRRRNKEASDLISEAKRNALELSRLNYEPSTSTLFRGDRSLSGVVEANIKQPLTPEPPSPVSPPRRARSLSPFTRRKSAHEVIADVYRKMEIDYSNSTTGSSNDEDGVEIVLAGITDPVSPNHGFLRKRMQLPPPTAINVLCKTSPNKQQNDEDETIGLQTIATVLFKEPPKSNNKKDESGLRRPEKSIRGRKSILIAKTKPESTKVKKDTRADLNVTRTTASAEVNLKQSPLDARKKKRGLIPKFKTSVVKQPTDKNGRTGTTMEPQSTAPKLCLDLIPPSSIAVGGRSRVSELSVPKTPKTTAIPLSSRVKTRSLGERSLAEIQTALEKVQKEFTGATKTGQTIPRDLVMEKLLAVADTIEAPADRNNFLKKISRLGSTALSHSSGDGVTTSDDSDSSYDGDTSTERYDTSGDESSFARWKVKRGRGTHATVGQWTRLLEALGLNGLWDDDIDLEDLDISRESIDENDDREQTDDETTDRTRSPTPPIVQKLSFTGFIGQIASLGSFRDDADPEPKKTDAASQRAQQVQVYEENQKRIAIEEEERMLRELEEMDRKIQAEKQMQRKAQASERLKKLAANLQKENERLERRIADEQDGNDNDIPESVIEMYVQELSAESRRAITDEQRLRRVIEEEIMKQKLVDTVLNKVQEEKLATINQETTPEAAKNVIDTSSNGINSVPSTSTSQISKRGTDTSRDTQTLGNSTVRSIGHPQLPKSNTRTTFSSARSRFTGVTSKKRSLLGSLNQSVQRDQISLSNTGTTLGSASLISQPQMTLSTITANTGYTFGSQPSPTQQSYASYNKNESIQGSATGDQFKSMSLMSDDQDTYYEDQSKTAGMNSQTPQPSISSRTRQSLMTKQSQQIEPAVRENSVPDANVDMNDVESYDDALSVGSIESHQFDAGGQCSVGTGKKTEQTSGSRNLNVRLTDEERSDLR